MQSRRSMCLVVVFLACVASTFAGAQSVADAAREARKDKRSAATVYTDDNIPRSAPISVAGPSAQEPAKPADEKSPVKEGETATAGATNGEKPADAAANAKQSNASEQRDQKVADWKAKFAKEKEAIALSTRELDVLQREYRLRAAAFYADAGNQLRNSANWASEDRNYRAQIEAKQKEVDAGKQKLEEMQEDARKDGMPSSVAD